MSVEGASNGLQKTFEEGSEAAPVHIGLTAPPGIALHPAFPIKAVAFGVPAILVTAAEYADMLAKAKQFDASRLGRQLTTNPRSRIGRDPELAAFLADNLGGMLVKEAIAACQERFGHARTPSRSAIDRFWGHLRGRSSRGR